MMWIKNFLEEMTRGRKKLFSHADPLLVFNLLKTTHWVLSSVRQRVYSSYGQFLKSAIPHKNIVNFLILRSRGLILMQLGLDIRWMIAHDVDQKFSGGDD